MLRNNPANTVLISNEAVTTYKTDTLGNPDVTFKYVNFVDTLSIVREYVFNNLKAGKRVIGFTDVHFCPLLANDLAYIFISMLMNGLGGLYHVVSSECTSKYEFGFKIARKFGLDSSLISPKSVQDAGLKAARSPNLTLRNDKLINDLGEVVPNLSTGLDRFYTLYQQGYPQRLRRLSR